MNKKLIKAMPILYHIKKEDWFDDDLAKVIDSLSYDDVLDFAEYVEISKLSSEQEKDRCDTVLRIEDIELFDKKSVIFHIVRGRDLMKVNKNSRPGYQKGW